MSVLSRRKSARASKEEVPTPIVSLRERFEQEEELRERWQAIWYGAAYFSYG